MTVTVTLVDPIQAHGETMRELVLREPRGKDIAACGAPRVVSVVGEKTLIEVDFKSVHKYISMLAGIPPSSVDTLSVPDWMNVQEAVLNFFERTAASSASEPVIKASSPPAQSDARINMPFQADTTI